MPASRRSPPTRLPHGRRTSGCSRVPGILTTTSSRLPGGRSERWLAGNDIDAGELAAELEVLGDAGELAVSGDTDGELAADRGLGRRRRRTRGRAPNLARRSPLACRWSTQCARARVLGPSRSPEALLVTRESRAAA